MYEKYSVQLYGLSGWDSAAKIERRLLSAGIEFEGVAKKKGNRMETALIFFKDKEQMDAMYAKMKDMREQRSESKDGDSSATSSNGSGSGQGRLLFKVREPRVSQSRKRFERPDREKGEEVKRSTDFKERPNKRARVELKEGDLGYAQAAAAVAAEGDEAAAVSSPSPSASASPPLTMEATLNDIVAPLWRKPYPDQLRIKRDAVLELMKEATSKWRKEHGKELVLPHEWKDEGDSKRALFCPLQPILPSPVQDGYRNKSEFSIGLNTVGEPTIGFLMGRFVDGDVRVESIDDCPHVPNIAKSLVTSLTAFIRAHVNELKPYDKVAHSGFWRLLNVRNSEETKEVMALVQVSDKGRTEEEMSAFRQQLVQHFKQHVLDNPDWSEMNGGYSLRALQLQLYSGVSNAAPEDTPMEFLAGSEPYIHERLMGLTFRVSQQAFFQINVPQTSRLYQLAADCAKLPSADAHAQVKENQLLLDVCCGTGTIGLALASRVGKVVGLEMNASAVEDAKYNATANGINNAVYYVGKAEDTLSQALNTHVNNLPHAVQSQLEVTAIVDPPRVGLHADVLRLLRRCRSIHRLVYVSCNPRSLMDNLHRLIQPASKRYPGIPFKPIIAHPVDMFPHTDHCEMVVLLERDKQKIEPTRGTFMQPTKQFAHQLSGQKKEEQTAEAATPAAATTDSTSAASQTASSTSTSTSVSTSASST